MLEVIHLVKRFPVSRGFLSRPSSWVHAVSDVSFSLGPRESLGLVGESGSGKTTIGRCLVRMEDPTAGSILVEGIDLAGMDSRNLRPWRRRVQYVFQDPYSALNPRMKVGSIIGEGLVVHARLSRSEIRTRVENILLDVGLSSDAMLKYPHEFSGGQRQRIAIARALILDPELLILDEPVSALDVSVQAQILNLLADIRQERSLAMIFISHNLAVIRQVTDRTAVLYLGRIVESGVTAEVLENPHHPYTASLIASVPEAGKPIAAPLEGEVPSNIEPPSGCPFHPRCPSVRLGVCDQVMPALKEEGGHAVACHFPLG
jgi:oligopeptide/dipeptide ABC transporter ATP-binding protein